MYVLNSAFSSGRIKPDFGAVGERHENERGCEVGWVSSNNDP